MDLCSSCAGRPRDVTPPTVWDADGGLPVILQDSEGNTYVYGLDLISSTDSADVQTYFQQDGLGSTTDLTDGSANVTASYGYDVFGALRSGSPGATPFLFTGEQRDAGTSLYYLRARYYDPAIGRFLGRDSVPGGNLYAYVGNNPVNLVDPYGLLGFKDIKKGLGKVAKTALDAACSGPQTMLACASVDLGPLAAAGPYIRTGVQVADLAPLGNVPIVGQATGQVLDIAAFLAFQYDIIASDCPWLPLTIENAGNLGVGTLGNLGSFITVNQASMVEAAGWGATTAYMQGCDSVAHAQVSGSDSLQPVAAAPATGTAGGKE